jgi:hypothetical protein
MLMLSRGATSNRKLSKPLEGFLVWAGSTDGAAIRARAKIIQRGDMSQRIADLGTVYREFLRSIG